MTINSTSPAPERHTVIIETEKTGRITLTPEQFDLLLAAASVGLDGMDENDGDADTLWDIVEQARADHKA